MTTQRFVFPMECPDCTSAAGFPYEATTLRGSVTTVRIALRCRACRHEWKLNLNTDPDSEPVQDPEA